jgi:hypothetical protein
MNAQEQTTAHNTQTAQTPLVLSFVRAHTAILGTVILAQVDIIYLFSFASFGFSFSFSCNIPMFTSSSPFRKMWTNVRWTWTTAVPMRVARTLQVLSFALATPGTMAMV